MKVAMGAGLSVEDATKILDASPRYLLKGLGMTLGRQQATLDYPSFRWQLSGREMR